MAKIISVKEAVGLIPDGATLMVGGYMGIGNPHRLIDALTETDKGGFTLIGNDSVKERFGVAKLIAAGKVKHLIASHVGANPLVAELHNRGEMELTLVPQGSLAEMIRAGGSGLGGIITPAGVGTDIEKMWYVDRSIELDGKKYLIEKPLKADFALIGGTKADRLGNVWFKGTTRNFNSVMATAADTVIVECEELLDPGELEPENIHVPFVFTDYVVCGGKYDGDK